MSLCHLNLSWYWPVSFWPFPVLLTPGVPPTDIRHPQPGSSKTTQRHQWGLCQTPAHLQSNYSSTERAPTPPGRWHWMAPVTLKISSHSIGPVWNTAAPSADVVTISSQWVTPTTIMAQPKQRVPPRLPQWYPAGASGYSTQRGLCPWALQDTFNIGPLLRPGNYGSIL